jgi:hypothetical protein
MGDNVAERRKLERFDLRLPAEITDLKGDKEIPYHLFTKNICSDGAFFETKKNLLAENSRVSVDLQVPTGVQIKVTGIVLRSEPKGVAVRFDNAYRMIPPVKNTYRSDKFYSSPSSLH